jgi:Zn-finger nucleic acid-binding protein
MRCPHCLEQGRAEGPYRDGGTAAPRKRLLEREQHPAGVEIDRCPACRGAFLDHGELERIEVAGRGQGRPQLPGIDFVRRAFEHGRRVAGAEGEPEREALDCPRCIEADPGADMAIMFEREWSIGTMVHVDVCLECRGVWLDPGELETLEDIFGAR